MQRSVDEVCWQGNLWAVPERTLGNDWKKVSLIEHFDEREGNSSVYY